MTAPSIWHAAAVPATVGAHCNMFRRQWLLQAVDEEGHVCMYTYIRIHNIHFTVLIFLKDFILWSQMGLLYQSLVTDGKKGKLYKYECAYTQPFWHFWKFQQRDPLTLELWHCSFSCGHIGHSFCTLLSWKHKHSWIKVTISPPPLPPHQAVALLAY